MTELNSFSERLFRGLHAERLWINAVNEKMVYGFIKAIHTDIEYFKSLGCEASEAILMNAKFGDCICINESEDEVNFDVKSGEFIDERSLKRLESGCNYLLNILASSWPFYFTMTEEARDKLLKEDVRYMESGSGDAGRIISTGTLERLGISYTYVKNSEFLYYKNTYLDTFVRRKTNVGSVVY